MATLGSSYSMRGYYEGRYRDKEQWTQRELQQHVWKRNEDVWVGSGNDFSTTFEFTPKHILPTCGFCIVGKLKEVNVRLDLGFANTRPDLF